jgi:hypothetical protein
MAGLDSLLKFVPWRKRPNEKGTAATNTYNPAQTDEVLASPQYRDHLTDIFTTRQTSDSRDLLNNLFRHDPDVSATVNGYLTVANTEPVFIVYDSKGEIDRKGMQILKQLITGLTIRYDYTKGFELRPSLYQIAEEFRYMLLLRGGIACELVMNKLLIPTELRNVDMATLDWLEKTSGRYTPVQTTANISEEISLDNPNFFVSFFRRNPTNIYTFSHFVAAINTIAARQQVINDLYRILQKTGFPRITVKVVEEVLRKNAPADERSDEKKMRAWLNARLSEISSNIANLRPDQAFVHMDSVETDTMNKGGPKQATDVTAVIEVLNGMNQAALKTMSTIIGRGESGVNTASTEARIFSMNADDLNKPVADIFAKALTFALRMQGIESFVVCRFLPAELRPDLELEPQRLAKQSRLLSMLSEGLIGDDEFHLAMFNRPRPDSIPELAGSKFLAPAASETLKKTDTSANDPLGRSVTGDAPNAVKDNKVKADMTPFESALVQFLKSDDSAE